MTIPWTPTAAEEVIIQSGTGGLKVDRLEADGTLRFRVEREPDQATQRTIINVALRCTKATSVVFAVLRSRFTSKPDSPPPNPMRDPSAEGAAVIADAPRKGPIHWCEMRHAGKGDCCGRVVMWSGYGEGARDEYGELDYPRHPWSTMGAGIGYACEAHIAEASAPSPYVDPAPEDAPTLRLSTWEETAECGCCSGYDITALFDGDREVARIEEDVPESSHDAARWARAEKRAWHWANGAIDLTTVHIVDGRTR